MAGSGRTSPVRFLEEQHDRVRELFATVAGAGTRQDAFERLVRLLAVHESALGNLAVGPVVGVVDRVRDLLRGISR